MATYVEIQDLTKEADRQVLRFKVYAEDETFGELFKREMMGIPGTKICGYSVPHSFEKSLEFVVVTEPNREPLLEVGRAMDNLIEFLKGQRAQISDKMPEDPNK